MLIAHRYAGFTLIEVLLTIVILAFGLLGLASLQSKVQMAEVESYQRAQAVLLLQDMVDRIVSNRGRVIVATPGDLYADNYVTTSLNPAWLGTGDAQPATCAALLVTTPPTQTERVAYDRCQWSNLLKGAAEAKSSDTNVKIGAMVGGRGCVEQVTAPDATPGVCQAGVYRVTVAWQGMSSTAAPGPALTCATGQYGAEQQRRAISADITVAIPGCQNPS